jgi:Arc/MetJ-type ribon-helix-helix transcriptional regulator
MVKYSTISVPKTLHKEIRRTVVEDPRVGYSSVAEFSKEAIKLRMDELRMELREQQANRDDIRQLVGKIKGIIETRRGAD